MLNEKILGNIGVLEWLNDVLQVACYKLHVPSPLWGEKEYWAFGIWILCGIWPLKFGFYDIISSTCPVNNGTI